MTIPCLSPGWVVDSFIGNTDEDNSFAKEIIQFPLSSLLSPMVAAHVSSWVFFFSKTHHLNPRILTIQQTLVFFFF